MIVDDYGDIAKRLKEIKKREMRADDRTLDDEIDEFLMGNEEEANVYAEYHDVYCG